MKALLLLSTILATAALAAGARADGLPVLGVDAGLTGVSRPGGPNRFVAMPVRRDTLLASVELRSGSVVGRRLLRGRWTIPAVAYDGSAAGLSADGRTLVLVRPRARFPRPESAFAVLDTASLRPTDFTLRGDFSFDAVSPDGRWVYLIQYTDPRDPTRYTVRLYDTARGRLAPEPIVDPTEPDEAMRGAPITRVSSPDGRWAYTLYDGGGGTPFVHALDTVGRTARCIDLDALAVLAGGDTSQLHMRLRGDTLAVDAGGTPLALVDTKTFATSEPAAASPKPPPAKATAGTERDGASWWIPAVTGVLLATVLGLAVFRWRPARRLRRPWRSRSSATPSR